MNTRNIFLIIAFFLSWGRANAQFEGAEIDSWLSENTAEMGGRSILLVWQNGHIVYSHAVNDMSGRQKFMDKIIARRQGKPADLDDFTPTSRIAVASCSKWFSAALVMTFVDEGKLKLSDTVGKYLPVLTRHGKGNITISECLSHLTGIKAPDLKESIRDMKEVNSMNEAVAQIADMPMEGKPGKVFRYSNVGLQIAGAVLEKITGKSFETLFAERIAWPLQMKNSDFGKGKVAMPAGGAYSTPEDYLNFLVMILKKGVFNNKRILSENSVAQMQVNRCTPDIKIAYSPAEAGTFGYGYGEWIMEGKAVTSPGLFGSFPWVNNDKKYAAFMMTYYLKSTGRHDRYVELKGLVDEAVGK
ncbi:serine hydrolase domain-containing protein [Mucilaginibacter sp.]|uniref:serine hydrolase domain-containing protein n=1 Tax=Mucilaginibacter sp. TaxID=1882438 RepID=UPI0028471CFE|nr:serine hydrolase domain-containing protein [Mucilaginibacter sp.]MDR3695332.1 serine hydrolase [Mucilaginibacter sp.]